MLNVAKAIAICEGKTDEYALPSVQVYDENAQVELTPWLKKQLIRHKPRSSALIKNSLRRYGYTVEDVKARWKSTRKDVEALGIMCECFALSPADILTCLGISIANVLPDQGESIVAYYAGA